LARCLDATLNAFLAPALRFDHLFSAGIAELAPFGDTATIQA
jgi:hypothetical protein